jgi:hypothetical protein
MRSATALLLTLADGGIVRLRATRNARDRRPYFQVPAAGCARALRNDESA